MHCRTSFLRKQPPQCSDKGVQARNDEVCLVATCHVTLTEVDKLGHWRVTRTIPAQTLAATQMALQATGASLSRRVASRQTGVIAPQRQMKVVNAKTDGPVLDTAVPLIAATQTMMHATGAWLIQTAVQIQFGDIVPPLRPSRPHKPHTPQRPLSLAIWDGQLLHVFVCRSVWWIGQDSAYNLQLQTLADVEFSAADTQWPLRSSNLDFTRVWTLLDFLLQSYWQLWLVLRGWWDMSGRHLGMVCSGWGNTCCDLTATACRKRLDPQGYGGGLHVPNVLVCTRSWVLHLLLQSHRPWRFV